ncbi:MAG: hypothetical protein EZS28_039088, partial [Streblomastix strix]
MNPIPPLIHTRRIQVNHGGISSMIPIQSNEDEIRSMKAEDFILHREDQNQEFDWKRHIELLFYTLCADPNEIEDIMQQSRPQFDSQGT